MDFNLVQLAITVRTRDPARLACWLATAGNDYSAACRNLVCSCSDSSCRSCATRGACPWHSIFGQELASDPAELKRHQKPPLPFMFSFPFDAAGPAGGGRDLLCGLVVVGSAIARLDLLLNGFAHLLAGPSCPVPAELAGISSRDHQGAAHPLDTATGNGTAAELNVLSAASLPDLHGWSGSDLHLRLVSPLRLFDGGRLLGRFDFSRFARSLMRRVSSLASYYGDSGFDSDFKSLSRQADAVTCTEDRFCLQADLSRKLSGIVGQGRFQGEFSGLLPFLVLGSYLHAGKGASYGMGRYELLQDS